MKLIDYEILKMDYRKLNALERELTRMLTHGKNPLAYDVYCEIIDQLKMIAIVSVYREKHEIQDFKSKNGLDYIKASADLIIKYANQ